MSEHLPHRLWHAASVLDDQTAFLRAVERFAWQSDDGSPSKPEVGSVHMWFEGGHGVHLDGASDWILEWSVSEPGDDRWMRQYVYDCHGRWVLRESTDEEPFVGLVGSPLTSAVPVFNEVNEVVGVTLAFEAQEGDAQPMGGRDRHVAQVSGSVRSCRAAFTMRAKDKDPKCQAGWSSDSSSGPAEMAPNGRRRVRRPSVGQ